MSTVQRDIWGYRHDSWSNATISGYDVIALDGAIGTVDAATADFDTDFDACCIVLHTGAWVLGKRVLLPVGVVESVDDQERVVRVELTKDQIKQAPELDETASDDDATRSLLGEYYGRFFMNAP
jgi:hypothetical protein